MYPPKCNPQFEALVARYKELQCALAKKPNDLPTVTALNLSALNLLSDVIQLRLSIGAGQQRKALVRMTRVLHITANQMNKHISVIKNAKNQNTDGDDWI
jgi:hypothetical protein